MSRQYKEFLPAAVLFFFIGVLSTQISATFGHELLGQLGSLSSISHDVDATYRIRSSDDRTTATGSISKLCGNNIVDPGEECDNGVQNGDSLCTKYCTIETCGNGIVSRMNNEECDKVQKKFYDEKGQYEALVFDTNPVCGTAGCTAPDENGNGGCRVVIAPACTVSSVSSFTSSSSESAISVTPNSTSEIKSSVSSTLMSPNFSPSSARPIISSVSSVRSSTSFSVPVCGNGVVDPGEDCDTGLLMKPNEPNTCRSCHLPACGDGILDDKFGEQCDDGANNSDTLPNHCRNNCKLPHCGDHVKDTNEECDGIAGCTSTCTFAQTAPVPVSICGNGMVETGEQCDDGSQNGKDNRCTFQCTFVTAHCGDGIVQGSEECDDGNNVNTDNCSNSCLLPRCGDGIRQSHEECDDGNTFSGDGCSMYCRLEAIHAAAPGNLPASEQSVLIQIVISIAGIGLLSGIGATFSVRRMKTK